ncbi:MAG: DUF5606 domain-containing protein [Paludibacter sp.]|nr:DUF5606 domain-containing protein [Paludibacter sp.]
MLKEILSISGKPGLYKLVSKGKNMLIVESLTDGKRIPTFSKDKVISLGDIAMFTQTTEVPLGQVLENLKIKENGLICPIDSKADNDTLRKYMTEILPDYDQERVYPSDIRKLIVWYNVLINNNLTDFVEVEKAEAEAEEKAEEKVEA